MSFIYILYIYILIEKLNFKKGTIIVQWFVNLYGNGLSRDLDISFGCTALSAYDTPLKLRPGPKILYNKLDSGPAATCVLGKWTQSKGHFPASVSFTHS